MNDPSGRAAPRRRQAFWLTASEVIGVVALLIAGLNFWDSHRQHAEEARHSETRAKAQAAFVVTGTADAAGRRLSLTPLKPGQAIQSQRYIFPCEVLDHAMEVSAARPQVDAEWIGEGLRHALAAARIRDAGEAGLPVGIVTTYVEEGDTIVDRSIYQIGYAWRPRLLGGPQIRLQGIALSRRAIGGDPKALAEQRWASAKAELAQRGGRP